MILPRYFFIALHLSIFLLLVIFSDITYAADTDLLKGSEASLKGTVLNTGKLFFYLIEAVIAITLFMKTRNLLVFVGIIVIAVFIEILTRKFLVAVPTV